MARAYDYALVEAIRDKAYELELDGIVAEVRPVPDDDRPHVLDTRFLDVIQRKLRGEIPSSARDGLMFQRHYDKGVRPFVEGACEKRDLVADLGARGIPVSVLIPENAQADAPLVVFLHGGCFTFGWFGAYRPLLEALALLSGAVVAFPEYRLAPEFPFPAAVDDSEAVVAWLLEHATELGASADKLVLAGDSAGGSLVNATILRRHGQGVRLAVLCYPVVDLEIAPAYWSWDAYPWDPSEEVECRSRVEGILSWIPDESYLRGRAELRREPEVSALHAEDVSFWPRTFVMCSEFDYLRVQDERFAARLAQAGVSVRLVRYAGCDHGFVETMAGKVPQVEDLCELVAAELRAL